MSQTTALSNQAPADLLERSAALAALDEALDGARSGRSGRLVLVGGEAGAGKTALLRHWCDVPRGRTTVLWGTCDPLLTPGPLGPLFDVAQTTGGELRELVGGGARPHEVATALLRELDRGGPNVLVLEDLHWADAATLDVLRLIGRRLRETRTLVIASYRDDQLERTHPLRLVLGELAGERAVHRLQVAPLSAGAVAQLAEAYPIDAAELFRRTNGNPFFVTEILGAAAEEIPVTVRDAVLARAARLSERARNVLDAVAIATPHAEVWLLEALAGPDVERLAECLASGMLTARAQGVAFRHELARLAIEDALAPDRRVVLHREALRALADPPGGGLDLARLADHAERAGDGEAVLRFAPAAAARAASLGAHREAAAQYARALRSASGAAGEVRAELLERRADECNLSDQSAAAIDAAQQALAIRRELGDRRREGELLRALAGLLFCPGRVADSNRAGSEALAVLESFPPGRELAMAYADAAARALNAEDVPSTIAWGKRAVDLAEGLGEREPVVRALGAIGTAELLTGVAGGAATTDRALELARSTGLDERTALTYVNAAWAASRTRDHALAERYVAPGLAFCSERGTEVYRRYILSYRGRMELDTGHWAQAAETAQLVLREPSGSVLLRILPLVLVALVRARRGDPEVTPLLDEALALALPTEQLQGLGPVAAARAEAAWLRGDPAAVAAATAPALELAVAQRSPWIAGELAGWRRRAGVVEAITAPLAAPWAAELAGEPLRAAALWDDLRSPYEAALARTDSDDVDVARGGLDELQRLGARAAAAVVARRLRERGVRAVPRGPRPATQRNPAGLSAREVEVLRLVSSGLRNTEIAARLFITEKTAGHHVSSILRKLGVRNRAEATTAAIGLGLAEGGALRSSR